jgi:hypothetical protein
MSKVGRRMIEHEYKIEVLRGHAREDGWILFNKSDSMSKARKIAANAMLHTNYLAVRIR